MEKAKGKNKRTVPVHYQQNQKREYRESHYQLDKAKKIDFQNKSEKNDNQESFDNESNQQYMQSSYQQKYSDQNRKSYGRGDSQYELQQERSRFNASHIKSKKSTVNHYELTFKKSTQQNEEEEIPQDEYQKVYAQKCEQNDDFEDESESFEEVKYDTKNTKDSKKFTNAFSDLDGLIQNREKLYQKYHSALINFYYLRAKQTKTIQEKHKEYLLSLLVQQLQKNIFINGLKLNSLRIKQKKQVQEDAEEIVQEEQKSKIQSIKKTQNNEIPIEQKSAKKKRKSLDKKFLQQIQAKLLIFQQITYGIVRKKLFQCFDTIISMSKVKVQRKFSQNNQKQKSHNQIVNQKYMEKDDSQQGSEGSEIYPTLITDRQNINFKAQSQGKSKYQLSHKQKVPQKSSHSKSKGPSSSVHSKIHQLEEDSHSNFNDYQQNYEQESSDNHQMQEEEQDESMEEYEEQQRKLEELVNYIHQLKSQALQTDSQLKRYFIKWKIYLLQIILEDYAQQQEVEEENQDESEGESSASHSYLGIKEKSNLSNQKDGLFLNQLKKFQKASHNVSKNIDDLSSSNQSSSNYADLPTDSPKQKKLILKSFLYEKYINQFWTHLSENSTYKKLLVVSKKLRQEKLKKNSLIGFHLNIKWREKQRAMTEYYHKVAEQQDLRQYRTAEVFYKTNLKAKYFFQFTKTCQQVKSLKKLDSLTLKLCFLKIYNFSDLVRRKEINIQRFFIVQKNKRLFKSFQGWKESTILSSDYVKLKSHLQRKDNQLIGQYFSILKLIHKASLVQQKKVMNFYKAKQTLKIFNYLKFLSKQSRETKIKQRQLREYLIFSKGRQFYDSFYEFYGQKVLQHRMKIRAQKLFYSRQKQFLYQRIQQWRNFVIRKQSYRAIEYRLIKLRQKEVKQNILGIWLDELDKRVNKRDELQQSAQHKDWLVRYYGSLCEMATSGKVSE